MGIFLEDLTEFTLLGEDEKRPSSSLTMFLPDEVVTGGVFEFDCSSMTEQAQKGENNEVNKNS